MSRKKRIGILGGMSPVSTASFYEQIISMYSGKFDDEAFPEVVIFSVNFARIIELQNAANWDDYVEELGIGLKALENAGADFIVIASNTPHIVYDRLIETVDIPLLSIIRTTAAAAQQQGLSKLLLLGTKLTMGSELYRTHFTSSGIELVTPANDEQILIDEVIFRDLDRGITNPSAKQQVLGIVKRYDVDGLILGCTELFLLITPADIDVPLLDTTKIHAAATLDYALEED